MSIELTMPRLSDTMESGTIIKWNVAEGDEVSSGDVVADIETDKATMELQVYDDGTIAKILVPEGKAVDIGTTIAIISEDGEDVSDNDESSDERQAETKASSGKEAGESKAADQDSDDSDESASTETAVKDAPKPTDRKRHSAPTQDNGNGRMRVSPVARQIAEDNDIDLRSLQGSGPSGRIIKRDVLEAIETGKETAAAVPPSAMTRSRDGGIPATRVALEEHDAPGGLEERTIAVSNMRQIIAKRLVESKTTIPHYQVTLTFNMDPLLKLRKELNEQLEEFGVKLSVNDFLVRCCALAMHEHPEFNASWEGDSIQVHGHANIGMAISLPAERGGGLVVGVIRDADRKSLRTISAEAKHLAEKARSKGLSIEEMEDSTFTLSNLGMFGVEHFTAIINPPNSAILAVGAAIEKPVVRDGEIVVGHEMSATLSSDHRVIDGAMSARFLQSLKRYIETPGTLLV